MFMFIVKNVATLSIRGNVNVCETRVLGTFFWKPNKVQQHLKTFPIEILESSSFSADDDTAASFGTEVVLGDASGDAGALQDAVAGEDGGSSQDPAS